MFERLDTRESGSGIGLATCRRVIEAHGGRIWIDEGADGGVAVHLTLPAQPRVGG
jgi:signal transduction histidine kinase